MHTADIGYFMVFRTVYLPSFVVYPDILIYYIG